MVLILVNVTSGPHVRLPFLLRMVLIFVHCVLLKSLCSSVVTTSKRQHSDSLLHCTQISVATLLSDTLDIGNCSSILLIAVFFPRNDLLGLALDFKRAVLALQGWLQHRLMDRVTNCRHGAEVRLAKPKAVTVVRDCLWCNVVLFSLLHW